MNRFLKPILLTLALIPLSANAALTGDVNHDGNVNISDINVLINMILTGNNNIRI